MSRFLCIVSLLLSFFITLSSHVTAAEPEQSVFRKENLAAWCIVPFDSEQRGPAARAEMLTRLGITKVAYDWRKKDIASFEEEILQYKKHDLEYFAFWSWHPSMEPLIRKYGIHPQIWMTSPSPEAETQAAKVKAAAESLLSMVEKTRELELKLGLYNHGHWGGEPVNMVAICEYLRQHHQADHVGIVYNFHHGHGHIDDFAEVLALMQPYLLCLNINGMADQNGNNKILPVGSGTHETAMLRTVLKSGYNGPIGILDHRSTVDAEQSLRENLAGLQLVVANLETAPE